MVPKFYEDYANTCLTLQIMKLNKVPSRAHIFLASATASSYLFVCVEILWPSQPIRVMSSVVSLPNHTFPGQA